MQSNNSTQYNTKGEYTFSNHLTTTRFAILVGVESTLLHEFSCEYI